MISNKFVILGYYSYVYYVMRERKFKPLKNMKLGLVRIQNEKLVGVQYFESKFQRELGEVVSINNVKWTVAVIGEDRDTIIDVLNGFIKKQNSVVRKQNQLINREANYLFNKVLREAIEHVNNY
jgi:single-stranded DNA-specific DHH superfamily exonuclease